MQGASLPPALAGIAGTVATCLGSVLSPLAEEEEGNLLLLAPAVRTRGGVGKAAEAAMAYHLPDTMIATVIQQQITF